MTLFALFPDTPRVHLLDINQAQLGILPLLLLPLSAVGIWG